MFRKFAYKELFLEEKSLQFFRFLTEKTKTHTIVSWNWKENTEGTFLALFCIQLSVLHTRSRPGCSQPQHNWHSEQIILCLGLSCTMFSSTNGCHQHSASSSSLPPSYNNQKRLQTFPNVPWGTKLPHSWESLIQTKTQKYPKVDTANQKPGKSLFLARKTCNIRQKGSGWICYFSFHGCIPPNLRETA